MLLGEGWGSSELVRDGGRQNCERPWGHDAGFRAVQWRAFFVICYAATAIVTAHKKIFVI